MTIDDISTINDKTWNIGKRRVEIISPLVQSKICSRKMVQDAATKLRLSTRYVYKLIHNYRQSHGLMTSITPQKPNGGRGKSRLSKQQEELIDQVINKFYLTSKKLIPAKIIEEIKKQCFEKQIEFSSEITIRRRLGSLSFSQLQKRDKVSTSAESIIGKFPKVDYPLDVVQIDHTLVDVMVILPKNNCQKE